MLLYDDVMADGETEAGALSSRLGRKERVEHFVFNVRRDPRSIIANPDFHMIAKVLGRGSEGRRIVADACFRSAPGRGMEAV